MDNLDINTLEGWNNQAERQMIRHLTERGIEPTQEAIQQGYDDLNKKCEQLQLKAKQEQEEMQAIADFIANIYMKQVPSDIPQKQIELICKEVNKRFGYTQGQIRTINPLNIGAVYLYGQIVGIRKERGKRK